MLGANFTLAELGMGITEQAIATHPNAAQLQEQFSQFQKSVTSGNPHALDSMTGLRGTEAVRPENLENTLRSIVEGDEQFSFCGRLRRTPTDSIILQHSTVTSIGGRIGDTFNAELGVIRQGQTQYQRSILRLAVMSTMVQLSTQVLAENHINDIEATEYVNAVSRILRDQEVSAFRGNNGVNPFEFDGLDTIIGRDFPKQIINMDGSSNTDDLFNTMQEQTGKVRNREGGYGRISDIYVTNDMQTELDQYLAPQWRVYLPGGENPTLQWGTPVYAIKTSFGNLKLNQSLWITESSQEILSVHPSGREEKEFGAAGLFNAGAPAAPTVALLAIAAPAGSTSYFTATPAPTRAGTYYYRVSAENGDGEGALSALASVTIVADQCVQITITPDAANDQTGYRIYRSEQDPAAAPGADGLRLMKRIPNDDPNDRSANSVYVDCNADLPGTSNVYLLDMNPLSIDFPELSPMSKFQLFPTNSLAKLWAVYNFGALRLAYPKRFRIIKNYQIKNATWKAHPLA